jgi:hypothetical protein
MDNAGFTPELEDLYRQAWEQGRRGGGAGELSGASIQNKTPQ